MTLVEEWAIKAGPKKKNQRPALLKELAKKYGVVTGKWMLFPLEEVVDDAWTIVARLVTQKRLGSAAKVSSREELKANTRTRVICVYTQDFTDEEDVQRVAKVLIEGFRNHNLRFNLSYKADIYTRLGIYAGNNYGIRTTIYEERM